MGKVFTTIGEAWLSISDTILQRGDRVKTEAECWYEVRSLLIRIEEPRLPDRFIDSYGSVDDLSWMRRNFREKESVPELQGARSYGSRLRDYGGTKDQISWVVERLRTNQWTRSATITTLEPLTDSGYVPCVSLIDFECREGAANMIVYARSLDFGRKAPGNLVCLTDLLAEVSGRTNCRVGFIEVFIKNAHIYEQDRPYASKNVRAFRELITES